MEKKLEVKDLVISFRTSNGKVQAVRKISFDLEKGETLAIVGESGSGKSVTSKAILGILAGNSIIEGGEIIYDGKDLLKLSEDEFHKIRGDKIAMIFQDPMSSLNPIVKIGRQLTEAMILKGKVRQKESRRNFNRYLKRLNAFMIQSHSGNKTPEQITAQCKAFDKFEYKHLELEKAYNAAYEAATEGADELENLIFELERKADKDLHYRVGQVRSMAKKACHTYVVNEKAPQLLELSARLKGTVREEKKNREYTKTVGVMKDMLAILKEAVAGTQPNFFSMGYYLTFANEPLPGLTVDKLNAYLGKYLDEHFMTEFISDAKTALVYTAEQSYAEQEKAIALLKEKKAVFAKETLDEKECRAAYAECVAQVMATVDPLATTKDNLTYTFGVSLKTYIAQYFGGYQRNRKEKKRYEKQKAKYDKCVARGREPEWQVVPASYTDFEQIKRSIAGLFDRLISHYEEKLSVRAKRKYDAETVAVIDYLKENASGVVEKVTKRIAKAKAIKLMEEVGIPEPRKRYNQYPFEFSGGMRQRIVIAIALAANPDILICDEPTTALDVTIQAQILELINKLKTERGISVIFITHDLGVVANMADRVAVMYAGKIVEYGTAEEIFYEAAHPYTWALLSSMPDLDTSEKLDAIPGTPPNMIYPPVGDAFAARNQYALKIDFERQPPMFRITNTHFAATWLLHPNAPKVEPPKSITDRITRMKEKHGRKEVADGK